MNLPRSRTRLPARPSRRAARCPECGRPGQAVQGQTVKALLAVSLAGFQESQYYFCATATCQTVYFVADGSSIFTVSELRERVYQKEPHASDVLICYCLMHTAGELRDATLDGQQMIVERITAGVQAEKCACDIRNPQGTCCLGNVRQLVQQTRVPKGLADL